MLQTFFLILLMSLTAHSQNSGFLTQGDPLPAKPKPQASAKIQGLLVNADSFTRDEEKDLVDLEGHVQIVRDTQHISCDRARIYLRSKHIELYGRVRMISPNSTVGGEMVTLDYETNTGMIYDGYVQSGSVIFEGKTLQKIGDNEYFVTQADYTTCSNCPASWSFAGNKIRAELGGYAYIKSSFLKVGGVRIFWLPYLIVPLKSDRQSGLLTPEIEQSSTGGWAVSQSFFWAINRSEDATLGIKNYEKRGTKSFLGYRYVLAENSFGEFNTALIRDRVFARNERLNHFRPESSQEVPINRWFFNYRHYYELPNGYVHRALLNNASDLVYSNDFPLETGNSGDPAMENRMSITKNDEGSHWHIDGSYYINMLRSNPLGGNNDAVHRAPEFKYSKPLTLINNSNLSYSVDVSYVNFIRGSKGYDDLTDRYLIGTTPIRHVRNQGATQDPTCENKLSCNLDPDGKYDPYVDLLRTGQRFEIKPNLYYPIRLFDGIDLFPRMSYQESHYFFEVGDERSTVRRLIRAELSARMTLSSVYGELKDPFSNRILHEIQPELKYTRIPWYYQPRHPFFTFDRDADHAISPNNSISDADLASQTGLQFDSNDRIYDTNQATFGVVNRWVEKVWDKNIPEYRQVALLKISQSYDFYQASLNDPLKEPWSSVDTVVNIKFKQFETYADFHYFPTQQVTNSSSRVRLSRETGEFFQVGLTRAFGISPGQEVDPKTRTEAYSLAAGFQKSHLNLMGKLVYDGNWTSAQNDRKIKSWAYIAQFIPAGNCWLITLTHDQSTSGNTNIRMGLEFNWDGAPRSSLPPDSLDQFGF